MTVLVAIVCYVIALLVVLILVGGVRRGDELHARLLHRIPTPTREPGETPRAERYSSPWSTPPNEPGRAPADTRGRSAARS